MKQNAETILKTYELFMYGDIWYSSFCKDDLRKSKSYLM